MFIFSLSHAGLPGHLTREYDDIRIRYPNYILYYLERKMSSTVFAQIPLDLLKKIVYNVSCEIMCIVKNNI